MQNTNAFIFGEVTNKKKYLHQALCEANAIIKKLEEENNRLKDVLNNLASKNIKGYALNSEIFNEQVLTA
jgi:hypothetical protein